MKANFFSEGVYISPTLRCNAACRHCVASEDVADVPDVGRDQLLEWTNQFAESGIKSVRFVGGEPFLLLSDLAVWTKRIKELGMDSTIVTNASWGRTKESARKALEMLPDLDNLVISSDKFHLEFIEPNTVKNAIEVALQYGKNVIMNITYIEKEDIQYMMQLFGSYRDRIIIQMVKTMPFDGSEAEQIVKHCYFQKPHRTPKFCWIGNYFISASGDVYACCQSSIGTETNYLTLGNLKEERLPDLISKAHKREVYRYIRKNGPRGIVKAFLESPYKDELMELEFASGCEICQKLLNDPDKYEYFLKYIQEE